MKVERKMISCIDVDVDIETVGITLLSVEEYCETAAYIPPIGVFWWLRSPGIDNHNIVCVRPSGRITPFGCYIKNELVSVRPALKLCLKHGSLLINDVFTYGHVEWLYIGDGLAIAIKPFCKMPFCEEEYTNDYEASAVKKYIEGWLKEVQNE